EVYGHTFNSYARQNGTRAYDDHLLLGLISGTTTSPSITTGSSSRNRLQLRIGMSSWHGLLLEPPNSLFGPVENMTLPKNERSTIPIPPGNWVSPCQFARSSSPQPTCDIPYPSGSLNASI